MGRFTFGLGLNFLKSFLGPPSVLAPSLLPLALYTFFSPAAFGFDSPFDTLAPSDFTKGFFSNDFFSNDFFSKGFFSAPPFPLKPPFLPSLTASFFPFEMASFRDFATFYTTEMKTLFYGLQLFQCNVLTFLICLRSTRLTCFADFFSFILNAF